MELLIVFYALVFDIVGDHCKVAVLTYRVGIIFRCPKAAAPQKGFYLRMLLEDMSGGDALDLFDKV